MYSKLEQQKGSDENIHIEFVGQKGGRGKKIKKERRKKENNRKNEIVISTNILCRERDRDRSNKKSVGH